MAVHFMYKRKLSLLARYTHRNKIVIGVTKYMRSLNIILPVDFDYDMIRSVPLRIDLIYM